jgi:hypothetical protein
MKNKILIVMILATATGLSAMKTKNQVTAQDIEAAIRFFNQSQSCSDLLEEGLKKMSMNERSPNIKIAHWRQKSGRRANTKNKKSGHKNPL